MCLNYVDGLTQENSISNGGLHQAIGILNYHMLTSWYLIFHHRQRSDYGLRSEDSLKGYVHLIGIHVDEHLTKFIVYMSAVGQRGIQLGS